MEEDASEVPETTTILEPRSAHEHILLSIFSFVLGLLFHLGVIEILFFHTSLTFLQLPDLLVLHFIILLMYEINDILLSLNAKQNELAVKRRWNSDDEDHYKELTASLTMWNTGQQTRKAEY